MLSIGRGAVRHGSGPQHAPAPEWTPPPRLAPRPATTASALALVAIALVFLLDAAPRIGQPFGNSHDGRNGAMWATGARAVVEDGPIAARFGALAPERERYAHHPPGTYLETAAAYALGARSAAALKAPAYLGSIAAIVLAFLCARWLGLRHVAAVVGAAAMVGTPMFLLYGAMLNHEAISLPWAFAALGLLARHRRGDRDRRWIGVVVGCGLALTHFEGVLFAMVLGAALVVRRHRDRPPAGPAVHGLMLGAGVASVLTWAWLWWANGGLREMWEQFTARSGGTDPELFVRTQLDDVLWGIPAWTVVAASVGTVVLWRRGARLVVALAVGVPAMWMVGLADGATHHEFWNHWLLLAVALGAATLADRFARGPIACGGLVVVAVALLVAGTWVRVPDEGRFLRGGDAARVITDTHGYDGTVHVLAPVTTPLPWVAWATRSPATVVDRAEIAAVARQAPDELVLVPLRSPSITEDEIPPLWDVAVARRGDYALVRAADAARLLVPSVP
jgi:hypothetical protein